MTRTDPGQPEPGFGPVEHRLFFIAYFVVGALAVAIGVIR